MTPDDLAEILRLDMVRVQKHWEVTGRIEAPPDHAERVMGWMRATVTQATREEGEKVKGAFKADDDGLFERIVAAYIEQFGAINVQRISATTIAQMQDIIGTGVAAGQGVDEIAIRLNERIPEIARARAAVIARTETHAASQFGGLEVAKTIPGTLMKVWASVEDHRVRDFILDGIDEYDHRSMDGVRVALDQPFRVPHRSGTHEHIMFPGDPAGSPGNIINCRCAMTYERV